MYSRQNGFGSVREILLLILASLLAFFAVTQYSAIIEQTKVNGAFQIANESKLRLGEFYLLSARFPATDAEKRAITSDILKNPEYIRDVVIEQSADEFDVVVKVFFKEDELDNLSNSDQFIYVAGVKSRNQGHSLDWTCGARGIENGLLPANCKG
jgi:Tfp pilus assembly protein PilE